MIKSEHLNNCFTVMVCSSEEGSYLRLVDLCITQLQAESNKEEEEGYLSPVPLEHGRIRREEVSGQVGETLSP